MSTLVRKGIHFCFRKIIAPKSISEDDRRHEYLLNIILTGFIGLLLVFATFLVISHITLGSTAYEFPVPLFIVIVGIFIGMLVLSRKGYFKLVTYLFLGIYFILATWNAFAFGVELPMATISFVTIIIISSILVSTQFSFVTTGIISITLITLGYFQVNHITHPDTAWKTIPILLHDPMELAISFFLIVILTWLSNREIESSLARARTSEHALIKERDNLELTVEERTKEIKSLQAEKVAQLYRSAEFGRLSSGLFHDLMNPLNALIGTIDLMKSNPTNISEVETYLEKSVLASKRMGSFLDSIRKQMSRHTVLKEFSCSYEIIEAATILTYRARQAGVALVLKQLDSVSLFGNPLKFHQIAINLIANAIDAYRNTHSLNPTVEIMLVEKHDYIIFSVTDHGSGISPGLLDTIFDPFFTTKDPHHGTGLGLSTTKTIVEQDFHGTIQVSSIESMGSTFTVIIPTS